LKFTGIGGVSIRFHWVFLLLLFVLGFLGYLWEALILFTLIFVHEIVHVLAARAHGLGTSQVLLFPLGGMATPEDALELDPQAEYKVALAGPLFNFLLAAVSLVIYANVPVWREEETFLFFIRCNLVLGFFNLLPALPLDGGRILRARLSATLGFRRATELAIYLSQLQAGLLAALGLYLYWRGQLHTTLFAAAFFLYCAAVRERTAAIYIFIRSLTRKKQTFFRQGVMPLVTLMALAETPVKDVLRQFVMKKYHCIVVVDKDGRVLGEVMEHDLVEVMLRRGGSVTMRSVLLHQNTCHSPHLHLK
jgi:stage IV sporulation protein FB